MHTKQQLIDLIKSNNLSGSTEEPVIFSIENGAMVRVGVLWKERGWYEEASNNGPDYVEVHDASGAYRFWCDVDPENKDDDYRSYMLMCQGHMIESIVSY